jgi:hypothetical protein
MELIIKLDHPPDQFQSQTNQHGMLRFNSGKILVNQIKECVIDHCKKIHQTNIQIINCRSSRPVSGNNHYDFLVYVQDALSFSFLLEQALADIRS